jgi:hypothetical protein
MPSAAELHFTINHQPETALCHPERLFSGAKDLALSDNLLWILRRKRMLMQPRRLTTPFPARHHESPGVESSFDSFRCFKNALSVTGT